MRILMVNKFLHPAGGAETYFMKLGDYLSRCGHQVEYFGMDHPENCVGNQWGLYTSPVDFHHSSLLARATYPFRIIYSAEARHKFAAVLNAFRPDVVHINNFNFQLTPSILVAVKVYRRNVNPAVRVIYTAHDSQLVCPSHLMYRVQQKQVCEACLGGHYVQCIRGKCIHNSALRSCLGALEAFYWNRRGIYETLDVIICPSSFLKQKLDTNPVLAAKTCVLRNFVAKSTISDSNSQGYILYFGRFSEEKGIRTLLEVCRQLPQIPFVFAGGGPLEHLIGGIPNVRNVGFLQGRPLEALIRGARFCVCPSECNDNCPFSVMESLMQGTPVLGAVRGGIPELIADGRTGWLFPAGDRRALQAAIERIWQSSEPEAFRPACRAVKFDSLEEYAQKLLQLYGQEGCASNV